MSNAGLVSKIEQLKELEALIREAEREAEALKDEIKREMYMRNTEEMNVGRYTVRYKYVVSDRLDGKALKRDIPHIYRAYLTQSQSMRFSIVG